MFCQKSICEFREGSVTINSCFTHQKFPHMLFYNSRASCTMCAKIENKVLFTLLKKVIFIQSILLNRLIQTHVGFNLTLSFLEACQTLHSAVMSSTYKCKSFGNSCILSVNFLKHKLGNPPSVYKIYENLGSLIII